MAEINSKTKVKLEVAQFLGAVGMIVSAALWLNNSLVSLRTEVTSLRKDVDALRAETKYQLKPFTLSIYGQHMERLNPNFKAPRVEQVLTESSAYTFPQ